MKKLTILLLTGSLLSTPAPAADPPPLGSPDQAPAAPSGTDWTAVKAQAEAQTAAYNAAKAAADAQKAMVDAQAEAAKARFGGLSAMTGTAGTVTPATDGGPKAEALLLATQATQEAAKQVASRIATTLADSPSLELVLLTNMSELSASDAIQFDAQLSMFDSEMTAASIACRDAIGRASAAGGREEPDALRSLIPALGAVLDSGAKIASYFQTDYAFGNVTITEPSNLTAAAIAAALRDNAKTHPLYIPGNVLALDAKPVLTAIKPLQDQYIELVGLIAEAKARSADVKAKSPESAARLDAAAAKGDKVVAGFEAFITALLTPAAAGKDAPIVSVLREKKLQAKMAQRAVPAVLLVSNSTVGAYYTKKNMWTFLAGSPPLYTMGGTSMTYTLFNPSSGALLGSGVVPIHAGYQSVGAVQRRFAAPR